MNKIKYYGLMPGDRIITPKSFMGMIMHHAIYLGQNYQGQDLIAENQFGSFVRIVTAEEFFLTYTGEIKIEPFHGDYWQRRAAVQRALKELGKPYELIDYNCESFANLVQHNKVFSKQSDFGKLLLVVIALFIFLD